METAHLENFEELLDEFKKLPDRVERPQTFMEIAGYPHYENVCSNILAFFMDPKEAHRLGTLVLDALASASNIVEEDEVVGGNVSVEREVSTDAGNRIDILIESDDRAVLIENKIYANVSNPFADYTDYLDRKANGRAKHKLLLTLYPTYEGSEWDFTNLTYDELVEQVRLLLGRYISDADHRYLTMFLDFLNTLENLKKGTRMDQKFVEFLAERNDDVERLLAEIETFKKELRSKVRGLRSLIDVDGYRNVEQKFLRESTCVYDDLIHYIHTSTDLVVFVETSIFPHGWEIWISPNEDDYFAELEDIIVRLEIPAKEYDGGFLHRLSFNHEYDESLKYDENPDRVRMVLQDLIDKLATYRGL